MTDAQAKALTIRLGAALAGAPDWVLARAFDAFPAILTDTPAGRTIRLRSCGPNKIDVIKIMRAATGLGLKETKDLVEAAPVDLPHPPDAENLRADLLAAGADIEWASA